MILKSNHRSYFFHRGQSKWVALGLLLIGITSSAWSTNAFSFRYNSCEFFDGYASQKRLIHRWSSLERGYALDLQTAVRGKPGMLVYFYEPFNSNRSSAQTEQSASISVYLNGANRPIAAARSGRLSSPDDRFDLELYVAQYSLTVRCFNDFAEDPSRP